MERGSPSQLSQRLEYGKNRVVRLSDPPKILRIRLGPTRLDKIDTNVTTQQDRQTRTHDRDRAYAYHRASKIKLLQI